MPAANKSTFETLRATTDTAVSSTYQVTANATSGGIIKCVSGRLIHLVCRMVSDASNGSGNQITVIPEIFISRDTDLSNSSASSPNPLANRGGIWIPCPDSIPSTSGASIGTLYAGAAYTAIASGFGGAVGFQGLALKSLAATGNNQTIFLQAYINPGAGSHFRCAVAHSGSGTAPAVEICAAVVD